MIDILYEKHKEEDAKSSREAYIEEMLDDLIGNACMYFGWDNKPYRIEEVKDILRGVLENKFWGRKV